MRPKVAFVSPPFLLPPTCLLGSTGCESLWNPSSMASFLLLIISHPGRRNCHEHVIHPTFDVRMSQVLQDLGFFYSSCRWDGFLHKNFLCSLENTCVKSFWSVCLLCFSRAHVSHHLCSVSEPRVSMGHKRGESLAIESPCTCTISSVLGAGHQRLAQLGEALQTTGPTCVHPAVTPSWTNNEHRGVVWWSKDRNNVLWEKAITIIQAVEKLVHSGVSLFLPALPLGYSIDRELQIKYIIPWDLWKGGWFLWVRSPMLLSLGWRWHRLGHLYFSQTPSQMGQGHCLAHRWLRWGCSCCCWQSPALVTKQLRTKPANDLGGLQTELWPRSLQAVSRHSFIHIDILKKPRQQKFLKWSLDA